MNASESGDKKPDCDAEKLSTESMDCDAVPALSESEKLSTESMDCDAVPAPPVPPEATEMVTAEEFRGFLGRLEELVGEEGGLFDKSDVSLLERTAQTLECLQDRLASASLKFRQIQQSSLLAVLECDPKTLLSPPKANFFADDMEERRLEHLGQKYLYKRGDPPLQSPSKPKKPRIIAPTPTKLGGTDGAMSAAELDRQRRARYEVGEEIDDALMYFRQKLQNQTSVNATKKARELERQKRATAKPGGGLAWQMGQMDSYGR